MKQEGWRARGAWLAGAAAAGLLAAPAFAQDRDLGRMTYAAHCASCHGAQGRGDGPMAAFLEADVPDLTAIQRDNDGVFPFARIYRIIESGSDNPVHAASPMPAWGEELLTQTFILHGIEVPPAGREAFVRGRILALIDHIAQLQDQ
jgi:mono/diheme cytochrome c family protein